jgi:Flp pilus assembly protein TadD
MFGATPPGEQPYPAGIVFLSIERYDIALRYFEQAVTQNPRDARAWFQAGFCMGKLGDSEAKLRAYRKALQLDPKYVDAHYSLGVSLLLAGRKCEANRELKALRPLDAASATKLEQLIELMGDPDACAAGAPEGAAI